VSSARWALERRLVFGVDPAGNDQTAHRAWQCWCGQPHEG